MGLVCTACGKGGDRIKGDGKDDSGKLLFGCLTRGLSEPLAELAKVLTFGARKYARDSWQSVPNARERYEDALQRHLNLWSSGESKDSESGLPHLAHASINILFLLYFELKGAKNEPVKKI
jgi:hypothetical protein